MVGFWHVFFPWVDILVKNAMQKKIAKSLDQYFLADGSADRGHGICTNAGNFFLNI
jgi:hypothetical protein